MIITSRIVRKKVVITIRLDPEKETADFVAGLAVGSLYKTMKENDYAVVTKYPTQGTES